MSEEIRVVVVDDHILFRKGLIALISDMQDVQVVGEASNGKAGLDVIAQTKPDLVLLDVNMPVMDGVDTVKAISIKVIRKSGRTSDSRNDCIVFMRNVQ